MLCYCKTDVPTVRRWERAENHAVCARVETISRPITSEAVAAGLGSRGGNKVVGVASDARYRSITQPGADLYVPYLQAGQGTNYVVIRGTRTAQDLASLVRRTLAGMDSTQAIAGVATIGELIDRNAARHRFNMILLLWFGVCSIVLAAMGIYSVIAEGVAEIPGGASPIPASVTV